MSLTRFLRPRCTGAPSTPVVDSYLGILRVRWDGRGACNGVDVHLSTEPNFRPTAETLKAKLNEAGAAFLVTPHNTVTYHCRLARQGQPGAVSNPSSGRTALIANGTLFPSKAA